MRLKVITEDGDVVFDPNGENVLVPFDEDERAATFWALTNALAVLSGIDREQNSKRTKAGVVLHLATQSEEKATRKDR